MTAQSEVKTAQRVLLTKREHAADCNRNKLGHFDPSGVCERCSAFLTLNMAIVG